MIRFVQCPHVFNFDFCGVAGGFEEFHYKVSRWLGDFYYDRVADEIFAANSNVSRTTVLSEVKENCN